MYLRLDLQSVVLKAETRKFFYAAVNTAMRRVLVDRARFRQRVKRGDQWSRIPLDDALDAFQQDNRVDMICLDEALRQMQEQHPHHKETIELRFFTGLTVAEIAEFQDCSKSKVEKSLKFARAWLKQQIGN